jgi:hypothetical protein
MATTNPIPVLDYPRNLYTHAFSYRSPRGLFIFGAVLLMAAMFAWVPVYAPAPPKPFGMIFGIGSALPIIAAVMLGFRILNGSHDLFHFTTAGVEANGKLVPWSKITRVAANAKDSAKLLQVFYTVQWSAGFTSNRLALNGVRISRTEYEQLIELLQKELSESYPQLTLGGYFSVET